MYTGSEILRTYHDWERDFQEGQGRTSLADFRLFATQGGTEVAGIVFDHPVDRSQIADTTTFRTVGFSLVGSSEWIVWVLTSVNATMDEDDAVSTIIDVVDSIRFLDGRITEENAFEIHRARSAQ
jgi:hypothetical protein